MASLLIMAVLAASEVSLNVAPGVVCVDAARLAARLEKQGVQVRDRSDRLAVTVELRGAQVVVRGLKRSGVLERSVPAKVDDCAAIERVIAALIASWSTSVPPPPRLTADSPERELGRSSTRPVDATAGSATAGPDTPTRDVAGSSDAGAPTPKVIAAKARVGPGAAPEGATTSDATRAAGPLAAAPDRDSDANLRTTTSDAPPEVTQLSAATDVTRDATAGGPMASDATSVDAPSSADATAGVRPDETRDAAATAEGTRNADPIGGDAKPAGSTAEATRAGSASAGATPDERPDATVTPGDRPGARPDVSATAGTPSGLKLELTALGGTSFGPTPAFTGRGQASVGLSFTRFGVTLDVGLESARARTVAPVTVTTSSQWASLNGLVFFRPLERLRLALSLGVRVWRIAAESTGADQNAATALASFGGVGAATGTFRLAGPLSLQVSAYASARWRTERFNVSNLGAILELLPWEGGLLGGLVLEANIL